MIKWQTGRYHPVVHLPKEYEVRDFTTGNYIPSEYEYDIGRYDELRPGMYSTELFSDGRFLHVGIDIGAPVGTPCMAFDDGEISHFGYNPADGDYGYVIITKHLIGDNPIWALYGHLSAESIKDKKDWSEKFLEEKLFAGWGINMRMVDGNLTYISNYLLMSLKLMICQVL